MLLARGSNSAATLSQQRTPHAWLLVLTAAAALTLGYHPYAEDGGVYLAGVKRLLNPALYPHYTGFVTEHLRFSLFAPVLATLVRVLYLGLPWTLLLVYCASLWLLLYAAGRIAARCFEDAWTRTGAVALTAAWCGLPVAGTALMLMDPYVTARSVATPLMLLAIAAAMDFPQRKRAALRRCGLLLLMMTCLHPLMAVYAAGTVALLLCVQSECATVRRWGPIALGVAAIVVAGAVQLLTPRESATQTAVAMTRYYWFPSKWEIYEWIGLPAPLLVLWALRRFALRGRAAGALIAATIWLGGISLAVALLYCWPGMDSHTVARLQPLRCFQVVYAVMLIVLGGWVFGKLLRGRTILAVIMFVLAALPLFYGQRQYYPASMHLELPGRAPRNRWVQAFDWAKRHTPVDALFAMDAHYITLNGEDAQCFRAIAERSAVPDYSKDGGETSITPALTAQWTAGHVAQTGLNKMTDAERRAKLLPLGVTWLVLQQSAETGLACPYANDAVKLCRLR